MKQTQARPVADQAADWVVQVQSGEMSAEQQAQFDAWYQASAEHRQAYQKERDFWQQLTAWQPAFEADKPGKDTAQIIPLPAKQQHKGQRRALLALAASLVLLAGIWIALPPTADYQTSIGEVRSWPLPDGSTLMLNTNSAVQLDFTSASRKIQLLRGEAWVDVQPDPQRPLRIYARKGYTEAVGTAFSVHDQGKNTLVTVTEGQVQVASPLGTATHYQPLAAGQALTYRQDQAPDQPFPRSSEETLAWTQGWLEINQQPLQDALAELERYRSGRIFLLQTAAAERQVSGIFRLNQLDEALQAMASTQNLKVVQLSPWVTLLY